MTPSTPEPDDTMCSGTFLDWTGSQDAWFVFTPDSDSLANFSLCDSASYDTSMVLYAGDCDTQVACNGDATTEAGCQSYYSGIYDWPVTAGTSYYIRIGGWQGATGAGTLTITAAADVASACCTGNGCELLDIAGCAAAGGTFGGSGSTCDDVLCYGGCPAGATPDCDACWMDGDDSASDCNGGLNAPSPVYQAISLGEAICGESSVFVDGPTGGTYRDLDWYSNTALNAGGDFSISVGSDSIDLLFGVVDNSAGAFVNAYILTGGFEGTAEELGLPAGDYSILCGAADWNTDWNCANGNVEYWMQLD